MEKFTQPGNQSDQKTSSLTSSIHAHASATQNEAEQTQANHALKTHHPSRHMRPKRFTVIIREREHTLHLLSLVRRCVCEQACAPTESRKQSAHVVCAGTGSGWTGRKQPEPCQQQRADSTKYLAMQQCAGVCCPVMVFESSPGRSSAAASLPWPMQHSMH